MHGLFFLARQEGFDGLQTRLTLGVLISSWQAKKQNPAPNRREILFFGTPRGIRTPDPLVRSQILYPAELLARLHIEH